MGADARLAQAAETGQIRRGRKFDQVLEGARDVFLSQGFEGASVDDIARVAGVSKATLYSYFPDKRLLFTEVASCECGRQAEHALAHVDMSAPPREVLAQVGRHFLGFILSDFGLSIFRICVAEADRFPDLGRQFYNSGPAVMKGAVVAYLQASAARGELRIEDYELAAEQFAELCKSDLWPRRVFNVSEGFSEAEVERVLDGAVETFMARYGACPNGDRDAGQEGPAAR